MFCRLVVPEDNFKRFVVFLKEVQAVVILRQSTNTSLLIVSTRCRWCFFSLKAAGDGGGGWWWGMVVEERAVSN